MTEYKVMWVIDVDAESEAQAAAKALSIHRDKNSMATVFEVVPRCKGCGEYHFDETKTIDVIVGDFSVQ